MLKDYLKKLPDKGIIDSLYLKEHKIHSDWFPFLSEEIIKLIVIAEAEATRSGFTPSAEKVLRFLRVPLSSAKIVILGQDPYPQPGVATGRAFEVGTLQSWNQPFQNISLKNILRALYKAYTRSVIPYNELKQKIVADFPILPPGKLFEHWERQGILLLNTSFTCVPGRPGSHQVLWEKFTRHLLHFIAETAPLVTWFVWGNHAAKAIAPIGPQQVIKSMHPMMCYNKPDRKMDFLYGEKNCFESFIPEIDWTGYSFKNKMNKQLLLF